VRHGIPDNFLGLTGAAADYDAARAVVLPIPYDATTSYAVGTRAGPREIIAASQQVELYEDMLAREAWKDGVATLPYLDADARGPEAMLARIQTTAKSVVTDGKFLLALGGEHSITSALVKAAKSKHKHLSVLQIDAHADLRDTYQNSPFSHACVMRRIHEMNVRCVPVGIRNQSAEEARYIKRHDLPIFTARACRESSNWIEQVTGLLTDEVYVTIDIDGFDPAYAPGTGTPEPGGLDWFQVTDLLAAVAGKARIVGADIVEVRPIPPNHITEFLAARLAYLLIGLAR
jgi:agmatinase